MKKIAPVRRVNCRLFAFIWPALVAIPLLGCNKAKEMLLPDLREEPTRPPVAIEPPDAGIPFARASAAPTIVTLADGRTVSAEYAEALELQKSGSKWLAQLKLQGKALGPTGTRDEQVLLREMCTAQQDKACLAECASRLGEAAPEDAADKRLEALAAKKPAEARDELIELRELGTMSAAGAALLKRLCTRAPTARCAEPKPVATAAPTGSSAAGGTVMDRARAAALSGNFAEVRTLLYPGVAEGIAGPDAVMMLRAACKALADAKCLTMIAKH